MTINEFIVFLNELPDNMKQKEICYIDVNYPMDSINAHIENDEVIIND